MTSFRLQAYFDSKIGPTAPIGYGFWMEVPTLAEATEIAALFPKVCKVQAHTMSHARDGKVGHVGVVCADAKLRSDGVNGGINETGIRRYNSLRKACAKLNLGVTFSADWACNTYQSLAEFEAAIGVAA